MISKEIHDLLNKQINAELFSAYYYFAMSICARRINVMGVSNWFFVQAREELDHSRILQNYLFLQSARIELKAIQAVDSTWVNPKDMFEDAYRHERIVTQMIHEISNKAQDERDVSTSNLLSWFIYEQLEEEKSCDLMVQKYQEADKNVCALYQIDNELKLRHYRRPHMLNGENWIA